MSIITNQTVEKYPELTHPAHGYIPMDIPETYDIHAVRAAYIAGAMRQPTDEEIEAVAETVWNKVMVPNGHRPWADTQECVMKADFIDTARIALETAQRKATEDDV